MGLAPGASPHAQTEAQLPDSSQLRPLSRDWGRVNAAPELAGVVRRVGEKTRITLGTGLGSQEDTTHAVIRHQWAPQKLRTE